MQLFPTGRLYVLCHHRVLMLSFIMYYELQSKTVLTLKYRWQDCKLNCVHVSSICELMHAFITERQCLVPKYCIPCVLFRIHWWEAQGLATRANLQCRFLKERKKKKKRERERESEQDALLLFVKLCYKNWSMHMLHLFSIKVHSFFLPSSLSSWSLPFFRVSLGL